MTTTTTPTGELLVDMATVKLVPGRATHRKLRKAGFAARGLDEAAMCQVALDGTCDGLTPGHELDGFLTDDSFDFLVASHREKHGGALADILCSEGVDRWTRDDSLGGWWIHDYLDYNLTASQWEEITEKKRAGGRASAQARASTRVRTRVESSVATSVEGSDETSVPTRDLKLYSLEGGSKDLEISIDAAFDVFWSTYPRRDDRLKALRAFEKALSRATFPNILDGAESYRDDPNRDPGFTKLGATWLNGNCWDNPPLPAPAGPQQRNPMSKNMQVITETRARLRG